jgi:hypothetical protein
MPRRKPLVCHRCGKTYLGWQCSCRKKRQGVVGSVSPGFARTGWRSQGSQGSVSRGRRRASDVLRWTPAADWAVGEGEMDGITSDSHSDYPHTTVARSEDGPKIPLGDEDTG